MSARNSHSPDTEAHWLGRWFTGARRDGFLALLDPQAWHTLSAILSFTSRDLNRWFTLDQLAVAIGQPRERTEERLHQLAAVVWREQPLIEIERDRDGAVAGAVLAPIEQLSRVQLPESPPKQPRQPAEVSASPPRGLRQALAEVGLEPAQMEHVLNSFPIERVQRQLAWLPSREARNPAALLLRAIEQDWEAPREAK